MRVTLSFFSFTVPDEEICLTSTYWYRIPLTRKKEREGHLIAKCLDTENLYAYFALDLFIEDLRTVLARRNITQRNMAKQVGIAFNTVNHVLNQSKSPGIHVITALLLWAGLDFEDYVMVNEKVKGRVSGEPRKGELTPEMEQALFQFLMERKQSRECRDRRRSARGTR